MSLLTKVNIYVYIGVVVQGYNFIIMSGNFGQRKIDNDLIRRLALKRKYQLNGEESTTKVDKKRTKFQNRAKMVKEINESIRVAQSHYETLKLGYIKFKRMIRTTTLKDIVTSIPNFQKVYKLFLDISAISKASQTPSKMVYALLLYMFPNLFGDDHRFIRYRMYPMSKIKHKIFSPFKLNLIRILVEERFYNDECRYNRWRVIGSQVDKMLVAKSDKYKIDAMYRLRPAYRIKGNSEEDTLFIKQIVEKCVTSQELVEKVLKMLFTDLFKSGEYKMYRHDADAENGFIGLDKIKLNIVHDIVEPCMPVRRSLARAQCKEMVNKYFENPLHILGKNLQECIDFVSE
ncbi:Virosome component [Orthopoxvirus akhmetapox]|uniref:Protein OPG067 n=2 Tax=Orthopoxvirus akhmetapox TaxID=2200830 RepID=A0A5J6CRJ4_9POXV|nr:Virosome component [Akhmeta virus]QEQ49829.1 Virosome component [Akhmeta virus]